MLFGGVRILQRDTTNLPDMEIDEPTRKTLPVEPEETEEDEPIPSSILLKKCFVQTVRRGRPTKADNKKDLDPNKPTKLQTKDAIKKKIANSCRCWFWTKKSSQEY